MIRGRIGWRLLLLSLVLGQGWLVLALDPEKRITQYLQTQWTVADGLPQSSIYAGLHGKDGFLWLATQEGLARFDGVHFETYNQENTGVFHDNSILALVEDDQGRLWIGTARGIYLYAKEEMKEIAHESELKDLYVWDMALDNSGKLWVGADSKGLLTIREGKLEPAPSAWDLNMESVYALSYDLESDLLWVGGAGGLTVVDKDQVRKMGEADGYTFGPVFELTLSQNGDLWISTDQGLIRRRDGEFKRFSKEDGLNSNSIYALYEDKDGSLWVGTDVGLNRLMGDRFEVEPAPPVKTYNPINNIWEDREGSLWVGRTNNGLFRYSNAPFTTFSEEEGLKHNFVWAVIQDSEDRMVIGTNHGLSFLQGNTITTLTMEQGLPGNKIRSLEIGPTGELWLGTTNGMVSRYENGQFEHFEVGLGGRPRNVVNALDFDAKGRLWVGSDLGIFIFENGQFSRPKGPLIDGANLALVCDSMGTVWVSSSTRAGYYKDGNETSFRELSLPKPAEVLSFHRDGRGDVWLGTYGMGLWRFDGANVAVVTKEQGLFDNTVYSLLEDDGFLWMSSNRGIFKVALEDLNSVTAGRASQLVSTSFGTEHGMKSSECNGATRPVGYRDRAGNFWYATTEGVVRVDPHHTKIGLPVPEIKITKIQVDSEEQAIEETIVVDSTEKQVIINYTTPSFRQPEMLRFRYRLKNYDERWHRVGDRRAAFYNHLPRGTYQFEVMATHGQDPWPTHSNKITIQVNQPFGKQIWVLVGLGALLLFGLVWLFLKRFNQKKQKVLVMDQLVDQASLKVARLEGTWDHLQEEYLTTIVEAGVGEMAGKVLHAVNQGLEDLHHRMLKVESTLRVQNMDKRLRRLSNHFAQAEGAALATGADQQPIESLGNFARTLKDLRSEMLVEVVRICDVIHGIGEMVEVQQDYAIIDKKIDTIYLPSLVEDVLRMQGTYLNNYHLRFEKKWQNPPQIRIHVLKLFLTLSGMVRQMANANKGHASQPREGLIEIIPSEENPNLDLYIWAPRRESWDSPTESLSKLTFLQEVQWLLAEGDEGELTSLHQDQRHGYRLRLKHKNQRT